MTLTLNRLTRAIPLVTAVTAFAAAAEVRADNVSCPASGGTGGDAYYDPCSVDSGWSSIGLVSSGTIPVDGVLVLQGAVQGTPPPPESIALTVATEGVPLAGSVEATQVAGVMVWRPDTAWTAGATYQITGSATNADSGGCLPADLPIEGEVTVDAGPGGELKAVELTGVENVTLVPTVSLQTLACCPGASPTQFVGGCGDEGQVEFDPTQCTPIAGNGFLDLSVTGTPAAEGPLAEQVVYLLAAEGFPAAQSAAPMFALPSLTAPICVAVDALDLGSGKLVPGVQKCFGEGVADQLGPQAIDPGATLECSPVVCPVDASGTGWDTTMCTPFDPNDPPTTSDTADTASEGSEGGGTGGQDGEKACACDASLGPAPGLLALVGLLGVARRRRRA